MGYKFARFPGTGRGYGSCASIRQSGQIGLNKGALRSFGLGDYGSVFLHYDAESQVIGLELVRETSDPAACAIVHRPGDSYISAKSFFAWFEIPMGGETRRYELEKDRTTGILIIDLKRPIGKSRGKHGDESR